MRCWRRMWCDLFLMATLILCSGCEGSDVVKAGVKGYVKFDGKPLAEGRIMFEPTAGTQGPVAGAAIINGAYEVPTSQGVTVGKNLVRINATKLSGKKIKSSVSNDMLDETVEAIPEKYNTKTSLEQVIEEGSNELEFDLK